MNLYSFVCEFVCKFAYETRRDSCTPLDVHESCFTYKRSMLESFYMSHVSYTKSWAMSHLHESCLMYMGLHESCLMYKIMSHVSLAWVMSHWHESCLIYMSLHESCLTYKITYEWVMVRIQVSNLLRLPHRLKCARPQSCARVMSHIPMSHVSHTNESCLTYQWVMTQGLQFGCNMRDYWGVHESCLTYKWDIFQECQFAYNFRRQRGVHESRLMWECVFSQRFLCCYTMRCHWGVHESCRTFERVRSHVWMSHVSHGSKSLLKAANSGAVREGIGKRWVGVCIQVRQWVMSHIGMRCLTHGWVMSCIQLRLVTYECVVSRIDESCLTDDCVVSHMHESCHAFNWGMSHMCARQEACHICASDTCWGN